MRQHPPATASASRRQAERRASWMSTGIAVLAIGAAVVLCFESFAAADQDRERLNATSTQAPKVVTGKR